MWFPVDLFNKRETTEKGGKIKRKINPDEPSGHLTWKCFVISNTNIDKIDWIGQIRSQLFN